MALIKCPECGGTVSNEAKICPHCGAPINSQNSQPSILNRPRGAQPIESNKNASTSSDVDDLFEESFLVKYKVVIIIAVVIILGVIGYFMFRGQQTERGGFEDTVDTAAVDTVEASVEENLFEFYGDGATFDVYGHVKNVNITKENMSEVESSDFNFIEDVKLDKNGKYISSNEFDKVVRNQSNKIAHLYYDDGGGYNMKFEYDNNGKVLSCSKINNDDEDKIIYNWQYKDNYVTILEVQHCFCEGSHVAHSITNPKTFKTKFTVKVEKTDDHGNWIKRSITGEEITTSTDGFEVAGEGDAPDGGTQPIYYKKVQIKYIENRKIKYYDSSTVSDMENKSSSVTKTKGKEYPWWIIDSWHKSTPQGFYNITINNDGTATLKVNVGMHEGVPEDGSWTYNKATPYNKVNLNFSSCSIVLYVDEDRRIIATSDGKALLSSKHPERNQYANPVKANSCPQCHGRGIIIQRAGGMSVGSITCPNCGGSGTIYR